MSYDVGGLGLSGGKKKSNKMYMYVGIAVVVVIIVIVSFSGKWNVDATPAWHPATA